MFTLLKIARLASYGETSSQVTDPEWRRHAHQHGSARLSNCAENSGPRTVCNRAAPYQAHVEIQLEPFLTVLRTVRPDSGKAAHASEKLNLMKLIILFSKNAFWSKATIEIFTLKNVLFLKKYWEKYNCFHNNIKELLSTLLTIKMFLEHQISIFLKDHVTPKTGVMILKIQLCHHRNKLYFKVY